MIKYLRAAHFPPTILVTSIAYLFSSSLFNVGDSLLIAITVFSGQLIVGWTNDLIDAPRDRIQGRLKKPLVLGKLKASNLLIAIYVDLTACTALSLLGPLGVRGGFLHLLAVGSGVSYNYYFKNNFLSPIPYIFSFAALPSAPYIALDRAPPVWIVICGGFFGVVAHFANVLKDLDEDQRIGIHGLPQLAGTKASIFIAATCLIVISVIISIHQVKLLPWFGFSLPIAIALIIYQPRKLGFPTIMLLALVDVTLLVSTIH